MPDICNTRVNVEAKTIFFSMKGGLFDKYLTLIWEGGWAVGGGR